MNCVKKSADTLNMLLIKFHLFKNTSNLKSSLAKNCYINLPNDHHKHSKLYQVQVLTTSLIPFLLCRGESG